MKGGGGDAEGWNRRGGGSLYCVIKGKRRVRPIEVFTYPMGLGTGKTRKTLTFFW